MDACLHSSFLSERTVDLVESFVVGLDVLGDCQGEERRPGERENDGCILCMSH